MNFDRKRDAMDFKILPKYPIPFQQDHRVENLREGSRLQSATDRDGGGQAYQQDQKEEEQRRPLTEEEFQEAVRMIESHPGVKNNHLKVHVTLVGKRRFVVIEDLQGKVVRRIEEEDLGSILHSQEDRPGSLYHRVG